MKINKLTQKTLAVFALLAFMVSPFAGFGNPAKTASAATPWDVSGAGDIIMNFEGSDYTHNVNLTQSGTGVIDGTGISGAYVWDITSGSIENNNLTFDANYTATADAVVPQTTLHVEATIAVDGSLSGTWSDNYNGVSRSGSLSATAGFAIPLAGSLTAEDFGVMDMSGVKGYTAGFGLTDATFENAQSVVIKLYSGSSLLQTNTLSGPNASSITGVQISSPFDVFGNFNYVADGYWVNVREAEYGQTLIPDKVVATVVLENGKEVTAENTNLTGNPSSIFPAVTTNAATAITISDATLNGTNGGTAGIGHSFWVSTSTFSTASPTLPAGVYSTADLGAIAANTVFSAPLSSVVGMPAVTPSTTYYFVAWTNVGGTWYPGAVLNFTTSTLGGEVVDENGVLTVTSIDTIDSSAVADGTFENGWKYVFNITVPTNEPNLAMKFADWARTGGGGTIPAANNFRISSAQADNGGATVLITAANTYSSPALHMVTDMNPSLDGIQVQVTIDARVPSGTSTGSYTTSYGVLSN